MRNRFLGADATVRVLQEPGTMTIAEAMAIVQAKAKSDGYVLQGPNWAVNPNDPDDARNLNMEAQELAFKSTGKNAAPVIITPPPGVELAEASQQYVDIVSVELGLPQFEKDGTPKEKPFPMVAKVLMVGAIGSTLFFLFRRKQNGKRK